ncbi:MAG: AraC family transcriptional regulator [Acidobacteriota bacterium]
MVGIEAVTVHASTHEMSRQRVNPTSSGPHEGYRGNPASRFDLGNGVELERFGRWEPGSVSLPPAGFHRLSTHVQENGNKARSHWDIAGQRFSVDLEPAMIVVVPADSAIAASWDEPAQGTLNFLFSHDALVTVLDELEMPSAGLELLSGTQGLDPSFLVWSQGLMRELRDERLGNRLMRDALVQQMLVHILRHYTNRSDANAADQVGRRDRLVPAAVSAALEYLHAHLGEPIELGVLASHANVSRFHFSRLFKQTIGRTPGQELTRLRVERAKELIHRDGRWKPLAVIAGECGFADQSHLGRSFKRLVGVTPGEFRRSI